MSRSTHTPGKGLSPLQIQTHFVCDYFAEPCHFGQISFLSLVKVALTEISSAEAHMLLLIIILVLLFGGGGGYYGYSRWGTGGGLGVVGTVLLILVVVYLVGGLR